MERYGNDCPNTEDGGHMVEWVDVPAQMATSYTDRGRSRRQVYGDHQRGICIACDQMFRRNP